MNMNKHGVDAGAAYCRLEQSLSLERCQNYIAHLRALRHLEQAHLSNHLDSFSFVLNSLESELYHHAALIPCDE